MSLLQKLKNGMKNKKARLLTITTVILLLLGISCGVIFKSKNLAGNNQISGELARAMTYDRVQDGDEATNSEYVNFDVFFLRDLDGDGYAEGVRGTCREVGNQDTLYMNLKIQGQGYLKDGRIQINSKNLYFEAAIPKDNDIRANAIGQNVKEILFNDLNTGTQRLLTGVVKSGNYSYNTTRLDALGNNINNYSQINSITLTGTHVAPDGTETPVEKTVEFNMDWYATVEAEVITETKEYELDKMIDGESDEVNLNFESIIRETKCDAFVNKAKIEIDVPQLNGYDAIRVSAKDADCQYDPETKKAVITKFATTDENGKIIKNVYYWKDSRRYTNFNVTVTYPLEAYKSIGRDSVEALFKTKAVYEGFNNPNEEFDNPYISNVAMNNVQIIFTKISGEEPKFDVFAGKLVYNPERYVIVKDNVLKLYNGISTDSKETYEVYWGIYNGYHDEGKMNKTAMKNTEADILVKDDNTEVSMDGFTSNIGIYFSNCNNSLYSDGYIKVYNNDTDELIETFTSSNWGKYTKLHPYKYSEPIDHVRIETSAVKPRSRVNIYNVKELNDDFFIENYSLEEFNKFANIKSTVYSDMNGEPKSITVHTANYEGSSSLAKLTMSKTILSTQVTEENIEMKIVTEASSYDNREKWKNGVFLVKLPKEIIDLEINNVTINNHNVSIMSYETYEENGETFIKIITENENPAAFEITINCNITPDPKLVTISRNVELYASNENCENYSSKAQDIYDINGNLNVTENVNRTTLTLNLVSPGTLLTNQVATNYDDNGSIAIAPQNAIIDKGQRKATVELEIKNGYKNTISDIVILGKVPAKGNKYAISNANMNSEFDAKMTSEGIKVPDELKDKVTVYYSENLEPNKDLSDTANNWAEIPQDWSKVKSYLIVFEDYSLQRDVTHKFTYDIEIPEALNYNEVSYSHHGVYFSLDTEEGKYKTYVEPNKLGFMIAKQFDLEITKYQKDSEKIVPQATYLIIEDGTDEEKARVTNAEGKILLKNIFVDKTYIVKEIKTVAQYELNQEEIKFRTTINEAGQFEATLISGTLRNGTNLNVTKDDNGYKLSMAVEDKVLPNIKIVTYEKTTGEKLSNIRYRLIGKGMPKSGKSLVTDKNGEVTVVGIYENEEYTLETVKADGYYLQSVKFTVADDGKLKVVINDGEVKESSIQIIDDIPVINLGLELEKIPTYILDITKVKRGEIGTVVAGAKFKLLKDENVLGEYTSDENGKIVISNLYQYVEGKDLNCTYTLKEIYAPEGYAKIKDIIFKVQAVGGKLQFIEELSEGQTAKTYTIENDKVNLIIEDSPSFRLVKRDGTTAELLPGAKFAIYNMDEGETLAKDSKGNILGTKEIIDGKEYYCITTNENGELSADLKEGFYKAVEVYADDRYDIQGNEYYFGIGATREGLTNSTLELYDVLGTSSSGSLEKISTTTDGGVVAIGSFKDTITLKNGDTITSKGDSDILVLKYNRKNQLEWYKQIGDTYADTGVSICGTSDGGVLVGVNFKGTITLENGDKVTAISPSDAQCTNGLVLKYGQAGELEWHKEYGGWWNQFLTGVIETGDGGTAVVIESYGTIKLENGDSVSTTGQADAIIVKYDVNQEVDWFDRIGGASWDKLKIKLAKDGGIIAYGYFQETMTLKNGDELTSSNGPDGITIKYDLLGEIEWYKQVDNYINDVLETSDGGLLLGGKFSGTITLDNGEVLTDAYNNNEDALLLKYDRNFELEWYKYIFTGGSEDIYSLLEVDDGAILASGIIGANMTLENGQVISRSELEGIIFKYNKDGKLLWAKQTHGTGNEYPNCMVRRSNEEILITGTYNQTISLEDGTKIVGNNNSDGIIFRLEEYPVPDPVIKKTVKFGAENNDYIQSVAGTTDGGFIAGGYFTNTITLENGDSLTATSEENGIILKYNKDGKLEWYKQLAGTSASSINGVAQKEDGSIIVAGRFQGTITIDGLQICTSAGGKDGIILEFTSEAELKWHKQIGGTGADEIFSVAASSDGGIIVGGEFNGTVLLDSGVNVTATSGADGIILKYDADGKFEYYRKVKGNNYDTIRSVAETTDGGIVAGGYYQGQVTLNNGDTLPIGGQNDGLILKYNKNGDLDWYKRVGDYGWFDYIYTVAPTSDGGIVAGGAFNWSFVLDNGETVSPASGGALGQDGLLLKYSKDGELQWYRKVSTGGADDCIYSVTETKDEGILLGAKKGTVGYIEKWNKDGKAMWNKELKGSGSTVINSIAESGKDTIIVGGYFDGNLTTVEEEKVLTSNGNADAFITKISAEMGMREVEELEVNNYLKEFKITTNVKEVSGTKGGTISGSNQPKYEVLMYGDSSTKEIKIVPDAGYELISVTVNDEEHKFETLADGSYIMPLFTDVREDKNIVATFALTNSKITINKVDSKTNEKLVGAKFRIEQIEKYDSASSVEFSPMEVESNSEGQVITQVPFGKYKITELVAPEGYWLNEEPTTIEFRQDGVKEFDIPNERKGKVTVHHYIKGTTTALAEDEVSDYRPNDAYTTVPKVDFEKYELEKDENGEYIIPSNAVGTYTSEDIVVTYYYVKKSIPLVVKHYIEGTEISVPLADGSLAEDEIYNGQEGQEYQTSSKENIDWKYELVEEPKNKNGVYQFPQVDVVYYYKLKEYNITTEVQEHEEIDSFGQTILVKGGTISGEGKKPFETVNIGENSVKDIIIQADEGYIIKSISYRIVIGNHIRHNTIEVGDNVTRYALYKFNNVTGDIHVQVIFEKLQGTVTVHHYIEGTTNKVPLKDGTEAPDEIKKGNIGYEYVTSANKDVSKKYRLVEEPANASGNYIEGNIEVIYYYRAIPAKVTVHHYIEGTTTKLAEDEVINGFVTEDYTTSVADVDNKYELVATPANSKGTMTEDEIVVTYYYRLKDTSVVVHYYKEGTTESLSADVTIEGKVDDEYTTTSATDIPSKYELVDVPSNANGTMTVAQTVVTYYYRLKETGVIVHYYKEGTTENLSDDVTITGRVDDTYTTSSATDIPSAYELVAEPENKNGTMTESQIVVIYYYRPKETSVLVHHYIEETTTSLSDDVTIDGRVFDEYETEVATDIPDKYELLSEPENKTGNMKEEQIVVTYYYKLKDTSVLVHHYLEGTTTQLSNDVTINGKVDDEYTTTVANDIPNKYELVEEPENKAGTMTIEQIEVTYYYRLKDTKVTVHHYIEGTTTKLAEDIVTEGKVDDMYVTGVSPNVPSKYEVVAIPANAQGTMTVEEIVVTYYYRLKDTSVLVHHYIKGTETPLSADVTINGKVDDNYTTTVASDIPDYYELVEEPENKTGTMVEEQTVVTYYYKLKEYSYVVNYLEKGINKELHTQKQGLSYIYGTQIDANLEKISIDGYNFDSFDKETLTITNEENVINIYYTKRTDLNYKVNYLEKDTNKILNPQKVVNNMTFGDIVKGEEEVINIDGYNLEYVDTTDLEITTSENIINIYYIKRNDLSYKVNYLEKDTNKELHTQKVVNNLEFETVIKSSDEVIEIDGYNYDSVDKDTLVISTSENVINIYYTKRNDLSYTVKYLEKDTNKELHTSKVVNNVEFETVIKTAEEVIDIDGYSYDSADKDELIITTGTNEITIYYTKLNGLSYTVNYLEKGTNKVIAPVKTQGNQVFESVITSSSEVIEIDGYNYDSVDKDTITITTGENVINIYYVKRTDLSYKVNYLEKTTNKVLNTQKIVNSVTFEDIINVSDEVITIDGYNYDSVDKDTLTISTSENIINIYYVKRNNLLYKVNYLEKDTDKVLSTQKVVNNVTFEDVITSSDEVIDIDGYNYDSVDKDTITITTGENVINIYYIKRNDLSYKVNYLEKDTDKVLHTQKVQNGMTFEATVNAANEVIEIDGYNYNSVDKDVLTIGVEENAINIYYVKRTDLSYKVNYLEKDTNKVLHAQKVQNGMTFEATVNTLEEVIAIDGYVYDSIDKESLVITTEENVINIYYTKKSDLSYKVNYLEKTTNKVLSTQKVVNNVKFESIINSADEVIDIDGYNYDSVDKATLSITTGENIINIYYVKRADLTYKVNYLEKTTNKVLSTQKVVNNVTFEDVITSSDEVITIDGYNYDSVDKDSLTITTGENAINIYYTKRTDLSYKVNYLEKDTNKVLHSQKIANNVEFEAKIKSSGEVIDIDGYNYNSVDKAELVITTGENIINIYYTKVTGLSYTVNYLEKGTDKVLNPAKITGNQVFETVVNSEDEVIEIDGYNYDSVDKELLTITTGENVVNIYYVKRSDLSYKVNYLEKDTSKVLSTQKVVNNVTFEDVINSEDEVIEINGYNYDSVDKATLSITTGENVINIYYAKRTDLSYKVNYLEKDTNKVLHTQKVQQGVKLEAIISSGDEVIEIAGYNYDSVDKDTITITTGENVINIYYTKRTDLSYKVNYLEKNTNKVLNTQKVVNNVVFESVVKSSDEVITIDGYDYDSANADTVVILVGENIINIYYTKRTDLSYKVNYLEKDTDKVLSTQKVVDSVTFEDVITSSDEVITIDGYDFDSVDKDELIITTGENVINIYYTKRVDLSYKVNYLEKGTNKVLNTQKVVNNVTFQDVITTEDEVIEIDGYNYNSVDKENLSITTEENVINIYYVKRNDLSYKVNYLEKDTGKVLSAQKIEENQEFESIIISKNEAIEIDGYTFDSADKDSLKISTGENIINLYYTKVNGLSYKVNYLEKGTNKVLSTQKVQDSMTFEDIVTSSDEVIDIDGYNYDSVDKDQLVITTGENVINIYYTKRTDLSYTVNYLEKGTNKVLSSQKLQGNMTFEDIVNSINEVITIDGYNYDLADKDTLTITIEENVINLYYTKRTDLSYIVNYLEKDTDKVLSTQKVVDSVTFEDVIASSDEVITIDGYDYDSVDKDSLTITTGENVINIYYTKRTDLSYKVNYLEKDTNKVLNPQKDQDGMRFAEVVNAVDEVIDIDGYTYDSADKPLLVIATGENTINLYYTKRIDLSYKVNYLEKDTDKVLSTQKVVNNVTFEDVIASSDEIITIDGYDYDSVDKDELVITTGENAINIYYTKRTDLSYTVNYLEKDTNKVLKDQKVVDNVTFEDVINSEDEVVDIYGYNFDSADKDTLTIQVKDNVINLYYTKKDATVIVHHYKEGTTEKVANDVTVTGKVGDDYETIVAEDLPSKYELALEPANKAGTMTEEQIEVIYYYKLKSTKVIVHHYEEGTTIKLSEDVEIEGLIDSTYTTTSADDIPIKYVLSQRPENATGIMTEEVIEVTYYYAVKDAELNIYYLEKDTDIELAKPEKQTGKVGEMYRTDAKEIEGYTLVENSGNTTGQLEVEPLTVIYYYLQNTRATVQYIDITTGEILDERTDEGLVGDEFVTETKNFTDYILVSEPEQKTVNMTKEEIVLKYYYLHISGGVIEQHIDVISGDVLYNGTHEGNEGDEYNILSKTFTGYDLVEDRLPSNSEGYMTVRPITVTYYYIHRAKVTTQYIDKTTGNRIDEDIVENGHEEDPYTTENKVFEGYKLIQVPENSNGNMTKEDIVVKYYYVPESAGVVERHLDILTDEPLVEERHYYGYAEDSYETEAKQILGYDLVKERYPENATGKMTKEEIVVTYYYSRKTQVQVKYIDKITGQEVAEEVVIDGHKGDAYTTEEKAITGYDLVEVPTNKEGTMTDDVTEVIYYYAKPAKVVVNYYDIDTKETIAAEEVIDGHESDEYETVQKEIKYYNLVEVPENKAGNMTVEDIVVNYYYKKKDFNLKVEKQVKEIAYNGQVLSVNGNIGKVELDKSGIATAEVVVTYEIKVTNTAQLKGGAELIENIPNGMTMNEADNKTWVIHEDTAILSVEDLEPGQERSYIAVMRWTPSEDNLGMKENIAEIVKVDNEAGFEEITIEDNKGKADLVISIKTGAEDDNTIVKLAILAIFAILGITVTVIIKKK